VIRAFLTTWSGEAGGHTSNPILDWIEANDPRGLPIQCTMHWPSFRADDGLPDKARVLVVVQQPTGRTDSMGRTIEAFAGLPGVYMVPAYRFGKPVTEIPSNVRQAIRDKLVAEGIPLSALDGIEVYGDFLRKVAKYLAANHTGFGRLEQRDAEFGDG